MQTSRRSLMKASGMAAVFGTTGLAGCSGLLGGGGGGAGSYQYDPGTLLETENKFFGTMNFAQMYEAREFLPDSTQQSFENTEDSPVDPQDVETGTGVGAADVSLSGQGGGTVFGSVAILGSFSQSDVEDSIQSEEDTQSAGSYEGFSLYETSQSNAPAGTGGLSSEGTVMAGVSDGAMVVGFAGSEGSESASVTGQQAVETMIDASNGNAPGLADNSQFAQQLDDRFGDATFMVGGQVDPALVEQMTSGPGGAGGAGMGGQMAQGIRAGGFGMTINGETTTMTAAAIYENADAAENSGVTGIINGFSGQITQQPGFDSVDAQTDGNTVVVTIEGQTEAIFSQGGGMGPGSGLDVEPIGVQPN